MRRATHKPESLQLLVCGLALGCVLVTLLASRSLFGSGAAVVHQIHQPRRGLQVTPEAWDAALRLTIPSSSYGSGQAQTNAASANISVPSWSSVRSLHHSRAERSDTLPKGKGKFGESYYHVFENVRMDWAGENEFGVYYYHPANESIPDEHRIQPKEYHKSDGPLVRIGTHYKAVEAGDPSPLITCKQWVHEPAIMFEVSFANNYFHFLNEGFLPLLSTLIDSDIAPEHVTRIIDGASGQCDLPTTPVPIKVVLIAISSGKAFVQPWSHLLDHITPKQATARQLHGTCFSKLIVGTSMLLDAFRKESGFQPESLQLRRTALHGAQRFLAASALSHKLQHLPPGEDRMLVAAEGCARTAEMRTAQSRTDSNASAGWRSGKQLPQVVLASRAAGPHATRSVLNEADLVGFIEAHWEVELKVTSFSGWLFDTVDLMQHTDFFLGMHGAGMTNVYFLPENASMMQLLPYGWNLTKAGGKERVVRGGLYHQMGRIQGARNHYWINSNPKHAFFQRKWFDDVNKSNQYQLHPGSSLELPTGDNPFQGWIYQDTFVDLKSLEPVLKVAFAEAGIHRRVPALPFKETFELPAEPPQPEETRKKQPGTKAQSQKEQQSQKTAKTKADAKAAPKKAVPAPAPEVLWTGIVCTGQLC